MYHLEHSNLVKIHDFFWDERNFYLVEDYCADGDLLDYILEQNSPSEVTAAIFFKQIILGVAHFHSYGVAHRDLKLENILIDRLPHIKIDTIREVEERIAHIMLSISYRLIVVCIRSSKTFKYFSKVIGIVLLIQFSETNYLYLVLSKDIRIYILANE